MPDYCAPAIIFAGGFVVALAAKPLLSALWSRLIDRLWRIDQ